MKVPDPKTAAGRAFVRSLNILLKFARLYGYDHARTVEQLKIAFEELRAATAPGSVNGLLLGATGSQLLLDGVPLEGAPAEKQFAQLLSAAGLASVQFFSSVTQDELARFALAFPTGKAKPSELAQQLKEALAGAQGIRINEICFVATDSRLKEASMAAQIAAASLGDDQEFKKWLNDPQKLLELIAAAQGSHDGETGAGGEGTGDGNGSGDGEGTGGGLGDGSAGAEGSGLGAGSASVGGSGNGPGGGWSGNTGWGSGTWEGGSGSGFGTGTGEGEGGNGGGFGPSPVGDPDAGPGLGSGHGPGGSGLGPGPGGRPGMGPGLGAGPGGGPGMGPGLVGPGAGHGLGPGSGGGAGLQVVRPGGATGGGVTMSGVVARLAGGAGAPGAGTGTGKGTGSGRRHAPPTEDEIYGILSALTSFGQIGKGQGGIAATVAFQEKVSELPGSAQETLKQALAALAAQAPNAKPDESVIVQLAEHLAIKFALERFERGEVKVNSVRQMLDRMNQEIENLRKILGSHEEKMSDAGMLVESHAEILDRQFWAAVPENGKRQVLLSGEAWCIPPRNVQSFVAELIEKGNITEAISILQNYAACAESEELDARKKTAMGLSEMAGLYAKADPKLLSEALRHLGLRLSVEQDSEVQTLVSAAFVRLSQEAATTRHFQAMQQALDLVAGVESQRPGIANSLRGKMGIEERVPDFVEEALRARQVAAGLTNVLRMLPQTTMEQLATRFNRCSLREDSEHVANLASDMGEEAVQYLRSTVRGGQAREAVEMTGLLSRLDPQSVMVFLPGRMKEFPRAAQDRIVRQISASGAARRCHILLEVLDHADPLVMPLVIDEIGVTGDREALGKLLTIADGDLPAGAAEYVRVKAIEALGRIHAPETSISLKRIAEAKKMFSWVYSQELRIAAMQALEKLEPEWVRAFLPKSGIEREDLLLAPLDVPVPSRFVRQRRHLRVRLQKPVRAVSTNLKENCWLEIKTASLSGGVATISRHLAPGTPVQLKLQVGLRQLQATALMRDYRAQDMAFEIVDMNLDERSKYRRLLAGNLPVGGASLNDTTPVPAEPVAATAK